MNDGQILIIGFLMMKCSQNHVLWYLSSTGLGTRPSIHAYRAYQQGVALCKRNKVGHFEWITV